MKSRVLLTTAFATATLGGLLIHSFVTGFYVPYQHMIKREMKRLCWALVELDYSQHPRSLGEAIDLISHSKRYQNSYQHEFSFLLKGVDPWGSSYLYVVDDAFGTITIRSAGPNRLFEYGSTGDDVKCSCIETTEGYWKARFHGKERKAQTLHEKSPQDP